MYGLVMVPNISTSTDESQGLDWHTRFKIIKGVCEGLNYLHNGSGEPIYHLDLKPANILLDKNMVPKIGDFGLSRLFPSAQTYVTIKIVGTP
jgi:pyruvate dehydrogenase phosphatase